MISYKKLYHKLYNDMTDIIFDYEKQNSEIIERLKQSQIEAEEMYLDLCEEAYPNGEDLEFYDEEYVFDDEMPEKWTFDISKKLRNFLLQSF